jgi:RHS repeat-associated protein
MKKLSAEQLGAVIHAMRQSAPGRIAADLEAEGFRTTFDAQTHALKVSDGRGATATLSFSKDGRVQSLVSPLGHRQEFRYDSTGRLRSVLAPNGSETSLDYDSDGRITGLIAPGSARYGFEYMGDRLVSVVDPDGFQARFAYDDNGRLASVIDRTGATTSYEYPTDAATQITDPLGREMLIVAAGVDGLEGIRFPDGAWQTYSAGENGELLVTTPGGEVRLRANSNDALARVDWSDGSWAEFTYDEDGELSGSLNADALVHIELSEERVEVEAQPYTTVTERRDVDGRLITRSLPGKDAVHYEYDLDGRLSGIGYSDTSLLIEYDSGGSSAVLRYPNGVAEMRRFGRTGRLVRSTLTSHDGTVASDAVFRYDAQERLVQTYDEVVVGGRRTFEYDPEGRVTSESQASRKRTYRYDAKGNLLWDGEAALSFGGMDEPTNVGGRSITYDDTGAARTTFTESGALDCVHSDDGLLREVTIGGEVWRYEYDAFCRRVSKTNGTASWRFGWSGYQMVWEEFQASPDATPSEREYLYEPDGTVPIAFREIAGTFWLQTDARGAVVRAIGPKGDIAWHGEYDTFGNLTKSAGVFRQPWRLAGHYEDDETGLHYCLARYYNPRTKSYLTRDPAFLHPGATHYSYARNGPWNWIDPYGALPIPVIGFAAGAVLGFGISLAQGKSLEVALLDGLSGGLTGLSMTMGGGIAAHIVKGAAIEVAKHVTKEVSRELEQSSEPCIPCAMARAGKSSGPVVVRAVAFEAVLFGAGKVLKGVGVSDKVTKIKGVGMKAIAKGADKMVRKGETWRTVGIATQSPLQRGAGTTLKNIGTFVSKAETRWAIVNLPGSAASEWLSGHPVVERNLNTLGHHAKQGAVAAGRKIKVFVKGLKKK